MVRRGLSCCSEEKTDCLLRNVAIDHNTSGVGQIPRGEERARDICRKKGAELREYEELGKLADKGSA